MNPETGVDLDSDLVKKIAGLLTGKYKAASRKEDAQLRELAFWRWVAFEGYSGKAPMEFVDHQATFMRGCYGRTGWALDKFSDGSIFELGCGPVGMIEFIPGKTRQAFDALNAFYDKLFRNLRSGDIKYIDSEAGIDLVHPADFGICFNVLDHTDDADHWLGVFFSKIKRGGHFILQVNTVQDGFERTADHKKMHPSPLTYEGIVNRIKKYSHDFCEDYQNTPSADNEFFFMAWGVHDR